MLRNSVLWVALCLASVGCATQAFDRRPSLEAVGELPPTWRSSAGDHGARGWSAMFDDPVLDALVREAQVHNRDVETALAAVQQARAVAVQAGAELLPSVDLGADSQRRDFGVGLPAATEHALSVQVGWELDIWGRVRASRQAARASADAAAYELRFARYSLAAAVARAYFLAIDAGIQEGIVGQSERNLQRIVELVELQVREGVALRQDLAVSESDLAAVRSQMAEASKVRRDAVRALELLLGRYPAAEPALRGDLPPVPAGPAAGLPSELLERRPDLKAAERRVAAAFHGAQAARAAKLPRFSLTGIFGGASARLGSVLSSGARNETLRAGLLAPIFQGGALEAQVQRADAEQRAALAEYGNAALEAFRDVESALDAGAVLARREVELSRALASAEEAFRIARLRFDHGDIDLFDVLSVEQRVFERKVQLSTVKRALLAQRVELFLALGGPWDLGHLNAPSSSEDSSIVSP